MTSDECEARFHLIRMSENEAEIESHLRALLRVSPVLSFGMGRGSTFWRGRLTGGEPFDYVHEMSYPPPEVAVVGRLNNLGQPCLYAASRQSTALSELQPKPGDHIQLLGFKIRADRELRLGAIGELFHVSKTGYLRSFGHDPENVLSRMLNSMDPERAKTLIFVDAFLAHLLARPAEKTKQYRHTHILAALAYENSGAAGFFYPSVQDTPGMNVAILPDRYDTQTHPVCCQYIRVDAVREFGIFDWTILLEAQGMTDNGKFEWQQPISQRKTTFFGLTKLEYDFLAGLPADSPDGLLELAKLYHRER